MHILNQTVSIREVQRQYKDVVATVQKSKKPVVVMNRSQAQLALINLEQLEEYERLKMFASLEKLRAQNQDIPFDEAFTEITEEVKSVRKQRHAKATRRR